MSSNGKTIILNHQQLQHTVKRIALQVYESFYQEKEIVLAGIDKSGYVFAEQLATYLQEISPIKVTLCRVQIDKTDVFKPIITSMSSKDYANKSVVLVDDVLNSGRVLMYAVKHFLEVPLKEFKTAVLINRNHKRYPVKADFKGLSLSTSLQEHVEVDFSKQEVYLE